MLYVGLPLGFRGPRSETQPWRNLALSTFSDTLGVGRLCSFSVRVLISEQLMRLAFAFWLRSLQLWTPLDLRAASGQTAQWWMSLRLLLSSLVVLSLILLAQASVT